MKEKFENLKKKILAFLSIKRNKIITGVVGGVVLVAIALSIGLCAANNQGAHQHEFINYVSNNDATENTDGTKTAKCTGCNETDTIADVGSATGTKELVYDLNTETNEYAVKGIEESFAGKELYIPMYHEGKKVTSILEQAFMSKETVEKVTITGNIKTIGTYAFAACDKITALTLNEGIETIGDEVFYDLAIEEVTLPNSITSLGKGVFYSCSNLMKVTLGNGLTTIPEEAFAYCGRLDDFKISESVTTIKEGAFQDCGLISLTIPSSVTTIENYAFTYCSKLVEVFNESSLNIGTGDDDEFGRLNMYVKTVKHAGEKSDIDRREDGFCFYKYNNVNYLLAYTGHETEIVLPESYNGEEYEIYQYGFSRNEQLKKVTISNKVTKIGSQAFSDCSNIESIDLGTGVKIIQDHAFYNNALTSIVIPLNVEEIEFFIFSGCEKLTNIYCEAASKPAGWADNWNGRCNATVTWSYSK